MKKTITFILTMTMLLFLVACTNNKVDNKQERENQQVSQEKESLDNTVDDTGPYGEQYISNHLKGDYSITYKITFKENNKEEEGSTVTSVKTDEGYYVCIMEVEMLYIKNGNKYNQYMGYGTGEFSKISEEQMTEEEVKSASESITGYMVTYQDYRDEMKKNGSETVAGRSCDKYVYEGSSLGYSVKFQYCIDKETGVCLKYTIESSAGGEKGGYEFECTEFKTSGVTLPKHN